MLAMINKHLQKHNIIIPQQSGFRTKRQTADNLLDLMHNVRSGFIRTEKTVDVFFDIEKAFDRVWHSGLVYKMIILNFHPSIIMWVKEFISSRSFKIKINNTVSPAGVFKAGVPQGAVTSPILFSLFINDISSPNNDVAISLFADDLTCYSTNSDIQKSRKNIQDYINRLENWKAKWKTAVQGSKCRYIVFGAYATIEKSLIIFHLLGQIIPKDNEPVFLGIKLDHNFSLCNHVSNFRQKIQKKLNLHKHLALKFKSIKSSTISKVYIATIRPHFEYCAIIINASSQKTLNEINGLEYECLRIAHRAPPGVSSTLIHSLSNLEKIKSRLALLSTSYIIKNIFTNDVIINSAISHFHARYAQERFLLYWTPIGRLSNEIKDKILNLLKENILII